MISRCYNPDDDRFKNYGAKGTTVCQRWLDNYEAFFADVGRKPSDKHSIDRFPNHEGNYEPGNCRWANQKEQIDNRSNTLMISFRGETKPLNDWCVQLKAESPHLRLSYRQVRRRLRDKGWSPELAFTTPVRLWTHKAQTT